MPGSAAPTPTRNSPYRLPVAGPSVVLRARLKRGVKAAILKGDRLFAEPTQIRGSIAAVALDAATGDRLPLRPPQSSGELVFCLSHACSLLGGAAVGAVAHNAAHNVFLTLPAYTYAAESLRRLSRGEEGTSCTQVHHIKSV